jgi:ankyrin repeat protein
MIRPVDLQDDDLWNLFQASVSGDLVQAESLLGRRPELVHKTYNYTNALHFAVREGQLPVVRLLLDRGANPHYQTHRFLDTLLTMAQDRDLAELAEALREIVAQHFPLMEGVGAFLDAAKSGDLEKIQADLAADPGLALVSNDTGDTALHEAAKCGHLDVINILLDAGAKVDTVRVDGRRPIHYALQHWDGESADGGALVQALLARGAAYNTYLAAVTGDMTYLHRALERDSSLANFEDTCHQRPISAAAERDDLEMVKLLLSHGADPSLPVEGAPLGQALWTAVYQNQPEMAKLLLEHGANPNTSPESSGSALFQARKHPELHRLLLAHGAHEDTGGRRVLMTAISDNNLREVERILDQNPELALDPLMSWGEGILARPANDAHVEMIELLLRRGAHVPEVCKWGPQYYFRHTEIGALLLSHGMNPNQMNWQRFSLLHYFAAAGHLEKVQLLLDHGADINAVDEEYRSTALGCAARWGGTAMVEFLLQRGADPNRAAASWATPLAWARKKRHGEIEALLLKQALTNRRSGRA